MTAPNIKGITFAEYRLAKVLATLEEVYPAVKPKPGQFRPSEIVAAIDAKRAAQRGQP